MEISDAKPKRPLISLTPLIDVVFILLVFFMLASSFAEWKFIELGVGDGEPLTLNPTSQSLIRVDFNGRYALNKQTMALDDIVVHVKEQLEYQSNHPVLIQPVDDLPLQELVEVLSVVGDVAGKNVSLVKGGE